MLLINHGISGSCGRSERRRSRRRRMRRGSGLMINDRYNVQTHLGVGNHFWEELGTQHQMARRNGIDTHRGPKREMIKKKINSRFSIRITPVSFHLLDYASVSPNFICLLPRLYPLCYVVLLWLLFCPLFSVFCYW